MRDTKNEFRNLDLPPYNMRTEYKDEVVLGRVRKQVEWQTRETEHTTPRLISRFTGRGSAQNVRERMLQPFDLAHAKIGNLGSSVA